MTGSNIQESVPSIVGSREKEVTVRPSDSLEWLGQKLIKEETVMGE
jgi:hypothetical protein